MTYRGISVATASLLMAPVTSEGCSTAATRGALIHAVRGGS